MVFRIVVTKPAADCALAYIGDYLRRVGTFFVPTRLAEFPRGQSERVTAQPLGPVGLPLAGAKYVPTLR